MTKFWTFFLDRHHFTVFLMLVLVASGVYAALAIPKEATPDIAIPLGIVGTALPGASAADVERLVTDVIEDAVLPVEGVSKVTSSSGEGFSSLSVEFVASASIEKSIALLKDAVDTAQAELPEEATDSVVSDVNFADQPILIVSISGNLAAAELTALGETVQDEIERVPGIATVSLSGVRAREVQVILSQKKLLQYGISVSDVTSAIAAAGFGAPAGAITVTGVEYDVRFEADITSTEDVAQVVVRRGGGASLKVADVATVIDGLEDPESYSRVSVTGAPGNPSFSLTVSKSRGGNIVETAEAVKTRLEEMRTEGLLSGTEIVVSYDGAEEVGKSLSELSRIGIETIALILIVLFATLGWREALVAAASIPLSFLIAFILMLASGNSINNVSLFSLILAIGILVDSGIVMVEAFHTRLKALGARAAALAAIREYAWPLIAGTFTTIVVFVPLFFLSGIVGKFLASIPYTVIFVLLASILVALGFVPLLSVFFVKDDTKAEERRQERYNRVAQEWYRTFLRRILHNKKAQNQFMALLGVLFVIALALPATGLLKSIFFPGDDFDYVYINIERPHGSSLSSTDLAVREVEEILYEEPLIESFTTVVGSGSSFSGGFEGAGSGSYLANITVNLPKKRKETSSEFVARMRTKMNTVESALVSIGEPEGGPPSAAPIALTFSGDDLDALTRVAERAARTLEEIPTVVNVSTSADDAHTEFVVRLDTAKAAEQGIPPAAVAALLRTALFSTEASSLREGSEEIDIRVKLDLNPAYKDPSEVTNVTIDAVRALSISGRNGPVALSSIADISYEPAHKNIRHEDGTRIMSVTGEVGAGGNAIEATAAFSERFKETSLEEGVHMKQGGESEDVAESFTELFIALIAGAALMLSILILEFNSFRHSFYLLLVIPLSLIGVHVGLLLVGQPLSLTSMLGVIALAGVIINHAIILMDSIARIHREHEEWSLEEVVLQAATLRLRPILLTTIVTVIGMLPLATASPFWAPLAFAIMFGLAFSLLLTLVLIPILYYRWPGSAVLARYASKDTG
ncbi:MAG: efflux RND transporter permease subunit [Minisyncoccia bacterium]